VIARLFDSGQFFEISPGWARNVVTGFARLCGRSVGILASQPNWLGGVLDSAASQKAGRHVIQCDRFGIPLIVLVDTPGFLPGLRQEREGVIRFGAGLVQAFASATVPRITLIIRKAIGGAFIAMNSRELGADYVFAWPQAQIGVMSARSAVGVIHRRALAGAGEDPELLQQLEARYTRDHLRAEVAAASGQVDELIEPGQTRDAIARALGSIVERCFTTGPEVQ